ncbi:hypothetical protein [Paracoccus alkanivorans]|uniref:hypothetical protein n=1 Tax=Paracoccus alkanivorans TaxID=2116655 RepID=UPI0011C437DF|nr:hypothetical protein [Paracoccus alkanivorans]
MTEKHHFAIIFSNTDQIIEIYTIFIFMNEFYAWYQSGNPEDMIRKTHHETFPAPNRSYRQNRQRTFGHRQSVGRNRAEARMPDHIGHAEAAAGIVPASDRFRPRLGCIAIHWKGGKKCAGQGERGPAPAPAVRSGRIAAPSS